MPSTDTIRDNNFEINQTENLLRRRREAEEKLPETLEGREEKTKEEDESSIRLVEPFQTAKGISDVTLRRRTEKRDDLHVSCNRVQINSPTGNKQ
ncbi:hypothetical protein DY000_02010380 [Brassica cretica]|uniref:Uncharacterized protein n=1 Tax=Brassica cretica TaxID=69181 RepID=A0ABQ7C3Z7_BRACR|nr:hypothetical protein DY000_02010380 [Brassica cretica]